MSAADPDKVTQETPIPERTIRFGVGDLLLVIGVTGYLCGLVTLGRSQQGIVLLRTLSELQLHLGLFSIAMTFIALLLFLLGPLWFAVLVISPALQPKLFPFANALTLIVACVLPFVDLTVAGTAQMAILGLGAVPLAVAWCTQRWMLSLPLDRSVKFWFWSLVVADLAIANLAAVIYGID